MRGAVAKLGCLSSLVSFTRVNVGMQKNALGLGKVAEHVESFDILCQTNQSGPPTMQVTTRRSKYIGVRTRFAEPFRSTSILGTECAGMKTDVQTEANSAFGFFSLDDPATRFERWSPVPGFGAER